MQVVYVNADEADSALEDDDVKAERRRITETPLGNLVTLNSVVVRRLTKAFQGAGNRGLIAAVDGLSFGIRRGECFGLLGINGAGKTTTFQMLTTDIFPTDGEAYVNSFSIICDVRQVAIFIAVKPLCAFQR